MAHLPGRRCAWCPNEITATARADSIYCSKRCRQASHRFRRGYVSKPPAIDGPLRLAYADPPYPGKSYVYKGHEDYDGEVDHTELVERLVDGWPDGWALSTSAEALPDVLRLCPPGVRVAAWHRGERPTKSRWPLNAWEPVIYTGGRQEVPRAGATRRLDSLVYHARARTTDAARVTGAKPAEFLWWLFDLLGARPGDELADLFPGSGGVSRAWAILQAGPPEPDRPQLELLPSRAAAA